MCIYLASAQLFLGLLLQVQLLFPELLLAQLLPGLLSQAQLLFPELLLAQLFLELQMLLAQVLLELVSTGADGNGFYPSDDDWLAA